MWFSYLEVLKLYNEVEISDTIYNVVIMNYHVGISVGTALFVCKTNGVHKFMFHRSRRNNALVCKDKNLCWSSLATDRTKTPGSDDPKQHLGGKAKQICFE